MILHRRGSVHFIQGVSSLLVLQKTKEDYFSQLEEYDEPFWEQWVLFVCLFKYKSFDQFNPPELPQILDFLLSCGTVEAPGTSL